MKLSILICDDLAQDRVQLQEQVEDYAARHQIETEIETVESGTQFFAQFRPGRWDMILMDIYMPGISGVETARLLRKQDADCILIFTTTSVEHGFASYEVQATDYLCKPIDQQKMDNTLDWCLRAWHDRFRVLRVRSEWEEISIPLREIRYIEIRQHTAHIHTQDRVIQTPKGIAVLEQEINNTDFVRCHRSFLINLCYVARLEKRDFILTDGTRVPLGSTCASRVRKKFAEWMFVSRWDCDSQPPVL